MDNEVIISFSDFGFQYTAQAEPTLYDINLQIRRGEKVLIAGPSGCGKSTLAHCINGLAPGSYPGKSTGKLTVGGENALELGLFGLSKIVGTVLQDSDGQFIGLTVAEDIAFALENDCIPTEQMHREVERIAELVDVSRVLHHAPHEISGGQKQRVSLGGVMVGEVDVLLFDEPLANLDPATGKQAIALIDDIQKRTGCAVIIIEHRVEDVLYRPVDRVIVMGDGRIEYDGDPDTLLCSDILISRARRNATYPARFQLIAAMNPCPCGHLGNAALSCSRAPRCAEAYQNKISGPLLDRIDLHVDVDAVNPWEMATDTAPRESSAIIRARVISARERQIARQGHVNALLDGPELERFAALSEDLQKYG